MCMKKNIRALFVEHCLRSEAGQETERSVKKANVMCIISFSYTLKDDISAAMLLGHPFAANISVLALGRLNINVRHAHNEVT